MNNKKSEKITAVLFDLDDTLISYDGVTEQAWETSCDEFFRNNLLEISKEDLLNSISEKRQWYWSDTERHKQGRKNMIAARREIVHLSLSYFGINNIVLSNELADSYSSLHDKLIYIFPAAIPTLEYFKNNGYKLGMITNGTSEGQRSKINRFGLARFFDTILIEGEVGVGKPDIAIYEKALDILGISPLETIMVGDNMIWDIEAPKSIGISTVWIDRKQKGLHINPTAEPDYIIKDISELIFLSVFGN